MKRDLEKITERISESDPRVFELCDHYSLKGDEHCVGNCMCTATLVQDEDLKHIPETLCESDNATSSVNAAGGIVISGGACK